MLFLLNLIPTTLCSQDRFFWLKLYRCLIKYRIRQHLFTIFIKQLWMTHLHVIYLVRIMKLFCSGNVRDLCFLTYIHYLGRICSLGKWSNTCVFPYQIFSREKCPLHQLWVVTPLTRVVQPLSDQRQICLSAEHSLRNAQQKILMAGFGLTSCSFPYQAKGNAAHRRNCRNRVSAGGCHQCQQNYTPRELKTFKAVDIFKAILRRFQRGTLFRTLDTPFFQEVRKI